MTPPRNRYPRADVRGQRDNERFYAGAAEVATSRQKAFTLTSMSIRWGEHGIHPTCAACENHNCQQPVANGKGISRFYCADHVSPGKRKKIQSSPPNKQGGINERT